MVTGIHLLMMAAINPSCLLVADTVAVVSEAICHSPPGWGGDPDADTHRQTLSHDQVSLLHESQEVLGCSALMSDVA